jgi:hypothetical protein
MISKVFELRSPATLIVILATRLSAENLQSATLLFHSGYGRYPKDIENYILVTPLDGGGNDVATTDPYMHKIEEIRIAHIYLREHFDELDNGSVIDIDYIQGNTNEPKETDMSSQLWED